MPTYEFRCPHGHATDRFIRSISGAPAEIECPKCGEPAIRQVSGGVGLHFKGSGFYITDYGKDGKKKPETAEKPASGDGASKTETASPAKPEAPKQSGDTGSAKPPPE